MPAPLVGGLLWGIGYVAARLVTVLFDFLVGFYGRTWAFRMLVGSALVLSSVAVTVAMSLAVKALIFGARVGMPSSLGASTYFLPSNLNQIIGIYFTARVIYFIWSWTLSNIKLFSGSSS
jgi:hypothetical protein